MRNKFPKPDKPAKVIDCIIILALFTIIFVPFSAFIYSFELNEYIIPNTVKANPPIVAFTVKRLYEISFISSCTGSDKNSKELFNRTKIKVRIKHIKNCSAIFNFYIYYSLLYSKK